jgi:VanZ family protein
MITNFLVDHSALVPVALALLALGCVAVAFLVRGRARVAWGLAVLSVLPVLALTLVPAGGDRAAVAGCVVQFSVPTLGSVELLANVALFLPPACFAALASRRPLWTFAAGVGLSAAVETAQAVVTGIGRACDTGDWVMNTVGAAVGVLLAVLVRRPAPTRPA